MYHVSAQGVDERMMNVHYFYYTYLHIFWPTKGHLALSVWFGSVRV